MSTRNVARLLAALAISAAIPQDAHAQIPAAEFAARRDSLAARIGDGVVVAFGGRNPITDFGPFYQLPAFKYLTNFDEPDAAFVLVARGGKGRGTIFVTPVPARTALYYGKRPDSAAVVNEWKMGARSASAIQSFVDSLAKAGLSIYHLADFASNDFASRDSLTRGRSFMRALAARHAGLTVRDAHPIVSELRARKSAAEMAILRKAVEISSEGHRAAMTAPEPQKEYEIQAALEHAFIRLGAARPGYGSIVGSGFRATQLHYMKSRGDTKPGELIVMDAAAEYEGYSADVTRTIPVSGTFTPEQRNLYQLVLDSQKAAERNSQVGMSASAATDSSFDIRNKGLARLGLVESEDATLDFPWQANCERDPRSCKQATFWTIHGINHGLGLEVHDPAGFYFGDRKFTEGDVFVIEPGIYVSSSMLDILPDTPKNRAFIAKVRPVVQRYENSGVRIEDDYLISNGRLERLTTVPREIAEIEALMAKRPPRVVP